MQLLETSALGLRSARHRLTSPQYDVSITLYPMLHVGERAFFERVYKEAFSHDAVLVEGVRSRISKHITRSYRWIDLAKLDLVLQPKAPLQETVPAQIIHADLSGDEFEIAWRKVPIRMRLIMLALSPFVGLHRRFFASRESLADRMSLEDHRSPEEWLSWNPEWAALEHSILGERDARLLEKLREQLDASKQSSRTIAVVFGAAHMRAVLTELAGRGFRSVESEWLTVFQF